MRKFRAIIAQDNTETAEGMFSRVFPAGCFDWRALPLTLTANHDDDLRVGRIDTIEMQGNFVVATGVLDDEGEGEGADVRRDVVRHVEMGIINGVSVEAGAVEETVEEVCLETDPEGDCNLWQVRVIFNRYQIGAASIVTVPALEGTLIELDVEPVELPTVTGRLDAAAASALTLDRIPTAWLAEPADLPDIDAVDGRTPHVTDDGRVFGYLAAWDDCLSSVPDRCQTPWRTAHDYEFAYHCGPFQLDDGTVRKLAPFAVQGGHYPVHGVDLSTGERYAGQWQQAQAHYDDPRACAAYVAVGENEHGIWYSGALRQGVTDEQLTLLRRHQPSGDWRRPTGDNMELLGMCSVNFPGFIRQTALTASADGSFDLEAAIVGGRQRSLTAAPCCDACTASGGHCDTHPAHTMEQRLAAVESLLHTLARNVPGVRDSLRARLVDTNA